MSHHVASCRVVSCHVASCHVISHCNVSCRIMLHRVVSSRVMSHHVMSSRIVMCHVASCRVMSSRVASRHPSVGSDRPHIIRHPPTIAKEKIKKFPLNQWRLVFVLKLKPSQPSDHANEIGHTTEPERHANDQLFILTHFIF